MRKIAHNFFELNKRTSIILISNRVISINNIDIVKLIGWTMCSEKESLKFRAVKGEECIELPSVELDW